MTTRSEQEIREKLEELAWIRYCEDQSGVTNSSNWAQITLLSWFTRTNYESVYELGEKLYKAGVRYKSTRNGYEKYTI